MSKTQSFSETGMTELKEVICPIVLGSLSDAEIQYLSDILKRFHGFPNVQQLWLLMDEQWQAHGCDPLDIDERVVSFYHHPVWLLNGLFIEQDAQSIAYRRDFTAWVQKIAPKRVADFGGGFGGLGRFIGAALPDAHVEVVEPYPHPAAVALAADTANVRFVPELTGQYDLLIATDVFEHVPDPIGLAANTSQHLRIGGNYLIANCFSPVILCHLPQLFHLQIGWDQAMLALGLQPREKVCYGRAYRRCGKLDEKASRNAENRARYLYPWIKWLPKGKSRVGQALMQLLTPVPAR